ncbi:MAG TPA: recombinase family protein [Acetobacteraceae bacterium]|nr:recombinase family protein [Acetobacteraceae bacterium]
MANGRFVAYYRVSTEKQGASGLGLEAQREAVMRHLNGGQWELIGTFTEVESGKRNDRPELAAALELCQATGATLVIAKLDRLARNVAFVSNLMETGVEFVAADFPQANRLTVHILAAVAEHEREMISQRTKMALKAAATRRAESGLSKLGNPANLTEAAAAKGRDMGRAARIAKADARAASVARIIARIQAEGHISHAAIARELTARCIETPRGGSNWQVIQVQRILDRTT